MLVIFEIFSMRRNNSVLVHMLFSSAPVTDIGGCVIYDVSDDLSSSPFSIEWYLTQKTKPSLGLKAD